MPHPDIRTPSPSMLPDFYRSEAFAEDVADLFPAAPAAARTGGRVLVALLPLLVALAGVAFAIVPVGG
jgi:hypothetical protein